MQLRDFKRWKVPALREFLRKRGLQNSNKRKEELIALCFAAYVQNKPVILSGEEAGGLVWRDSSNVMESQGGLSLGFRRMESALLQVIDYQKWASVRGFHALDTLYTAVKKIVQQPCYAAPSFRIDHDLATDVLDMLKTLTTYHALPRTRVTLLSYYAPQGPLRDSSKTFDFVDLFFDLKVVFLLCEGSRT